MLPCFSQPPPNEQLRAQLGGYAGMKDKRLSVMCAPSAFLGSEKTTRIRQRQSRRWTTAAPSRGGCHRRCRPDDTGWGCCCWTGGRRRCRAAAGGLRNAPRRQPSACPTPWVPAPPRWHCPCECPRRELKIQVRISRALHGCNRMHDNGGTRDLRLRSFVNRSQHAVAFAPPWGDASAAATTSRAAVGRAAARPPCALQSNGDGIRKLPYRLTLRFSSAAAAACHTAQRRHVGATAG